MFEPFQVGEGTPGGCESVVHVCRQWFKRNIDNTDKILAQLDVNNAFNSLDRHEIVRVA